MIPKIIHYMWFSGEEKTPLAKRCIESWRRFCPDWEIVEWDLAKCAAEGIDNRFFREALAVRKWAFAADYVRLYAVWKYGGFYMDSDIQLHRPIDEFREHGYVSCWERVGKKVDGPLMPFFGAEPCNEFVSAMLHEYDDIPFVRDGEFDQTTNIIRAGRHLARLYGITPPFDDTKGVHFGGNGVLFPSHFFCNPDHLHDAYATHLLAGGWVDAYARKRYWAIGPFRLLRFKRMFPDAGPIELHEGERMLFCIKWGKKRFISLVHGGKERSA